jgi:O-antigen/teichoic acid export membrane protein
MIAPGRLAVDAPAGAIARNTGFRLLASGLDVARAAITMPLIARQLGPDGFGTWGVATALLAFLTPLAVSGITGTLVRECARLPASERTILDIGARLRGAGALACVPLAALLALVAAGREAAVVAALLTCSLCVEARATRRVLLTVRLRDGRGTLARLAASTTYLLGVLVWAWSGGGIHQLAALMFAQAAIDSWLAWHLAAPLVRPSATGPYSARTLLAEAWPTVLFCLVSAAHLQLDVALVAGLAGAREAGLLAAAARLAYLPLVIPAALTASLMPVLGGKPAAIAARAVRQMAVVGAATLIGLVAVSPWSDLLFGDGFEEVSRIVPLLGVRVALLCLTAPICAHLIAARRQRVVLGCRLVVVLLGLGSLVVLAPLLGASGAAWAAAGSELVGAALLFRVRRR